MTDIAETIARVRELDAAATKGPWMAPHARVQKEQTGYVYRAEGMASQVARTMSTTRGMSDAALIADYRTACPQLAAECERLRERVGVLEEALREIAGYDLRAEHSESAAHEIRDEARAALKGSP